jgi:hypothetical protein
MCAKFRPPASAGARSSWSGGGSSWPAQTRRSRQAPSGWFRSPRRGRSAVSHHQQAHGDGGEQPLSHATEFTRPTVRGRLRVYLITVAAIRVRYRTASGAQPLRVQRVVRRNVVNGAIAGVCHGCCQRGSPKHCSRVPQESLFFTAAQHAGYQLPGLSGEPVRTAIVRAADDCQISLALGSHRRCTATGECLGKAKAGLGNGAWTAR